MVSYFHKSEVTLEKFNTILDRFEKEEIGDKFINFKGFLQAFVIGTRFEFEEIDMNGNGFISKFEFEDFLSKKGFPPGKVMEAVRKTIEKVDQNGDERLTFKEVFEAILEMEYSG